MKETIDFLEDVSILLPKPIVVWYIVKNFSKKYDITKKITLGDKLLSYAKLEMHLLSQEMSSKIKKTNKKESDMFLAIRNNIK